MLVQRSAEFFGLVPDGIYWPCAGWNWPCAGWIINADQNGSLPDFYFWIDKD